MQWASAVSHQPDLSAAVDEATAALADSLGTSRPDLVVAFVAREMSAELDELPDLVAGRLAPRAFVGCTAAAVVGSSGHRRASTRAPSLALTAALLPGVDLHTFLVQADDLPSADAEPEEWSRCLGVPRQPETHFVLLSSPVGATVSGPSLFDPRPLLMGLDYAYGRGVHIGGVASALDTNRLFADARVSTSGCVGLALHGALGVDTIVSQGARPFGEPMAVTGCQRNQLIELDHRPAVEVLVELFHRLSPRDQLLAQRRLHLGIAITELKTQYERGDFLVRNILQIDHDAGHMAIGDRLRPGQTVQFHLRDAGDASREVAELLKQYTPFTPPAGCLLFTCTGRTSEFFGEDDADARHLAATMGDLPLAGMYCSGEIGQIGPTSYIHGYTACFAFFRPGD